MYEKTLAQIGLTEKEAQVYELLLSLGRTGVGPLLEKTALKRGNLYDVLSALTAKGLITETKERGKKVFVLENPIKLADLVTERSHEIAHAEQNLKGLLPGLVSKYTLVAAKPGVRFFEGPDGVRTTLEDSLTSATEILSYADIESITKHINEVNSEYVAERARRGIKKRGILLDTPFARQYLADYHRAVTETKLIAVEGAPPFQSVMQIYDHKISYITLAENKMIGVIIADPAIYELHRYLFEYLWKQAPTLTLQPPAGERSKTQ